MGRNKETREGMIYSVFCCIYIYNLTKKHVDQLRTFKGSVRGVQRWWHACLNINLTFFIFKLIFSFSSYLIFFFFTFNWKQDNIEKKKGNSPLCLWLFTCAKYISHDEKFSFPGESSLVMAKILLFLFFFFFPPPRKN